MPLRFVPALKPDWLHSVPGYDSCVQLLRTDPLIGRYLDHLVGTGTSASRLAADSAAYKAERRQLCELIREPLLKGPRTSVHITAMALVQSGLWGRKGSFSSIRGSV